MSIVDTIPSLARFTPGFLRRRDFLWVAAGSAVGFTATAAFGAQAAVDDRVPLGLDAHSVRGMRWKAGRLIEYAAEHGLDAILFNGLNYFESLDTGYLKSLKAAADSHGIRIRVGAGSICENSVTFSSKHGDAKTLLAKGIRVAVAVGSPTVNCRIGKIDDRYSEGGIEARITEVVKVMKALRAPARDAGIKFAFENHAGDLRSDELLGLIEATGPDLCGVMLDPGNAVWAMEDPMRHVQTLGRHVLCTSVRDYMVWESEAGATLQWTAIGDGLMDAPAFTRHMATLCPGVPIFVESISNSPRLIPILTEEFWKGFPHLQAADMVDFLALCRRGRPIEVLKPPQGIDAKTFDQQHQHAEFKKSVDYLRRHCEVGNKG